MQMTEHELNILDRLHSHIYANGVSNECLVEIFKLTGNYLNLQNVSDYAKSKNITPQAVYKSGKVTELFNVKFVIDNE